MRSRTWDVHRRLAYRSRGILQEPWWHVLSICRGEHTPYKSNCFEIRYAVLRTQLEYVLNVNIAWYRK